MVESLELNALRLENASRTQEQHILNAIASCGIGAKCYAYKTRVKPEAKLVEKVSRKVKDKPNYNLQSITDVIGLRLITLFKHEISKILREVILLIKHQKEIKPNPFKLSSFEEVIIYNNSLPHDPLLVDLQNVLHEFNIVPVNRTSQEGYSSVHIVCRLDCSAKLKNGNSEIEHQLPVEIQVRSVFEDAWGEVDHRFGYAYRSGKQDSKLIYNTSLAQPHLKVLKSFTDACAQYADTIYELVHTPYEVKDTNGKILSVASDDEVLQRFASLGIPTKLCDLYVQGRHLRENALSTVRSDRTTGQSDCMKAAAFFLELNNTANSELEGQALFLYCYYAKMNEALCLLSTGMAQHVKLAENIYIELLEKYPDHILIKFRLAQACSKLGATNRSIMLFLEAQRELEKHRRERGSSNWPDELPKADYEHMHARLPKLLGYQYWRLAQDSSDLTTKLHNLQNAHDITLQADDADPHTWNNLVYYSTQYLSLFEMNSDPTALTKKMATSLHINLAKMEFFLKNKKAEKDAGILETMMSAYNLLGKHSLAKIMAEQIIELTRDSTDGDAEETLHILRSALQIKALQLPSTPDSSS